MYTLLFLSQSRLSSASWKSNFHTNRASIKGISAYANLQSNISTESTSSHRVGGNLRLANAVARPYREGMKSFPCIIGKALVTKPSLRDKLVVLPEVACAVKQNPLPDF
jgi:hypothetical protein